VNIQQVERLKGLLARVELNAKKPRQRHGITVSPIELSATKAAAVSTPRSAPKSVIPTAATKSAVSTPRSAPKSVIPTPPPLVTPSASLVSAPSPSDFEVEDVALDEFAVELPPATATPHAPPSALKAVASPPTVAPTLEIEDVSAEDLGIEDLSFDEIAEELPPVEAMPAPVQTAVHATAKPLTTPPAVEELTFSEPPPPKVPSVQPRAVEEEPEAPPLSTRKTVSEAPSAVEDNLFAATSAEVEEPLLTPPPESGKQRTATPTTHVSVAPTVEQLGEVLELGELAGPSLELDEAPTAVSKKHEPEELEFVPQTVRHPEPPPEPRRPPMATLSGGFTKELPTGVRKPEPAPVEAVSALTPEVIARTAVVPSAPVIDVIAQAQAFRPQSFLELLDASLKLGTH
jgi:hypothetical protein